MDDVQRTISSHSYILFCLTWRSEGPGFIIIKVCVTRCESFSGKECVGYCATGPVERVSVIMIRFGEINLNVCLIPRHLMEVERSNVTPHFQGIVHKRPHHVPAQQSRLLWKRPYPVRAET